MRKLLCMVLVVLVTFSVFSCAVAESSAVPSNPEAQPAPQEDEIVKDFDDDAYYARLLRCAGHIQSLSDSFVPDVVLVLGSGLGNYAETLNIVKTIPYDEIRGWPTTSVAGHSGNLIFATLDAVQALTDREGKVASIEVSALTTPDNDLARRAARNPAALTSRDYETWYCTAYVSAICYQIQEAITGSVASAVRQVAESEGMILDKTKLLMILITALSLIGSALGISNLVTASVMERAQEIGLLKAIGAKDHSITGVVMTEILITALIGLAAGTALGFGFAQLIGRSVFGSAIDMNPAVIPIVAALIALVTIAGSLPAIRMVLRLKPAEVLHGGH